MNNQSYQGKALFNIMTKTILLLLLALLVWEHTGRQYGTAFKPSVMIEFTGSKSRDFFYFMGTLYAQISSYLTWIDLEELKITVIDLVKPLWKLLESPFEALRGYYETACTYELGPWQIYLGSFLLLCVFGYMMHKYCKNNEYVPWLFDILRRFFEYFKIEILMVIFIIIMGATCYIFSSDKKIEK